jgi:hypothetical protein
MAYRLQAEAFGDLDRRTVRLLERMANRAAEKLAANGSATLGSDEVHDVGAVSVALPAAIAAPREGSKLAEVIKLLQREGSATIDQLVDAMGWLPHTTRAALTGLRKRGFEIDRRKRKDQCAGAYVIVDSQTATEG